MKPQMLLKLKRIKRQSRYQPMNEGHEAGSDAIKVKKNKKTDFKTLNIHSAIQWERERERERERDWKTLRSWGRAGLPEPERGSSESTDNGRSPMSDRSTAGDVYRSLTEHRRSGAEADLRSAMRAERRRRRRASCGVAATWPWVCWGLVFICVLAISFFFFF